MPTVKQADSLWIDYDLCNYKAIDSTWSNWAGTYEISTTESATPSVTGNLTKATGQDGIMQLRLSTDNTTWNALAVGTYKLMVQFTNSTYKYREERHDKLIIKTQGV